MSADESFNDKIPKPIAEAEETPRLIQSPDDSMSNIPELNSPERHILRRHSESISSGSLEDMQEDTIVSGAFEKENSGIRGISDDEIRALSESQAKDRLIGEILANKYEILSRLGSGGMSVVYRARDKQLDKIVAVKVLKALQDTDEIMLRRFRQEALSASQLHHPNIINTFEFNFTEDGRPYLVMEYLDGHSLSDIAKIFQQSLDFDLIISMASQICDGLAHAHDKGIVHRDIKPSNLVGVRQKTGEHNEGHDYSVLILDFGIAKLGGEKCEEATKLTQTGEVFGSPAYMSPEQTRGEELDGRSDIYSLGCVLYELICGMPPFSGQTILETLLAHSGSTVTPLHSHRADVPAGLEAIVLRCLEKKPENRYATAAELQADLERLKSGTAPRALQKLQHKRLVRLALFASLATIILVGATSIYSLWSNPDLRTMIKIIAVDKKLYSPWWQKMLDESRSYRLTSRWDEAEQVLRACIEKAEKEKLPADEIYNVYGSGAAFFRDRRRFDLAVKYYELCLAQGDWPHTRAQRGYLAYCLLELGELDQALKNALEARDFFQKRKPDNERDAGLRFALETIGRIYFEKADYKSAYQSFQSLLQMCTTPLQESEASWLLARTALAMLDDSEADSWFAKALAAREQAFGKDDPGTAKLAESYQLLKSQKLEHPDSMRADYQD